MRSASWILSALVSLSLWGSQADAEQLEMTQSPQTTANRPARGMSMQKVEATFGAPASRVPPVGSPPISRWEYPGFVVFFEHDHVIHSVAIG
jgi:hypothetical protein